VKGITVLNGVVKGRSGRKKSEWFKTQGGRRGKEDNKERGWGTCNERLRGLKLGLKPGSAEETSGLTEGRKESGKKSTRHENIEMRTFIEQ